MKRNKENEPLEPTVMKEIEDLGAGAYLLMMGFKVAGKRDKSTFAFEVPISDEKSFEEEQMAYLNSDFHRFDACLMSLKKIHNFLPRE